VSTLERAIALAADAHQGQKDKAGQPYILHPLRIMLRLSGEQERIAAVLHDVVEDTHWTLEQLRQEGFAEGVLEAVEALTRREGEDYFDFVRRAAENPIARVVKIADLEDNADPSRIADPSDRDLKRIARYHRAMAFLRGQDTAPPDVLPPERTATTDAPPG